MDMLNATYGYEADFVSDVPDYLHCLLCHLVLRDPVMVIECGHKFCGPCFSRLSSYAQFMHQELRCPTDMAIINPTQVCKDIHLKRVVGGLVVRCGSKSMGCSWEGELSELPTHEKKCPCKGSQVSTADNNELLAVVNDLQSRVCSCEESLLKKDKEISHLNFIVQEKSVQIDVLMESNSKMADEMKELKEERKKMEEKMKELITLTEVNRLELMNLKEVAGRTEEERAKKEELRQDVIGKGEVKIESATAINCLKFLVVHQNDPDDFTISTPNTVTFHNRSTLSVSTQYMGVTQGQKAYFEVAFKGAVKEGWSAWSCIGWLVKSSKLHMSGEQFPDYFVGKCTNSWSWMAQGPYKHHCKQVRPWGKRMEPGGDAVVGVAADMDRGELLYSCNGVWKHPMGVAFNQIDVNLKLFPAISGHNIKLLVNFGERPFRHSPPDLSYKTLMDVI